MASQDVSRHFETNDVCLTCGHGANAGNAEPFSAQTHMVSSVVVTASTVGVPLFSQQYHGLLAIPWDINSHLR